MNGLPKFVTGRLARPGGEPLGHPDADLLTAFLEQKVTRSEREQVFAHLSQCSACREIVTLAAPDTITASAAPATASGPRTWLRWRGMRWVSVAAASVVVLAIGIALRPTLSEKGPTRVATEVVLRNQETAAAPLTDKISPSETSTATSSADARKEPAPKATQKNREVEPRSEISNSRGSVGFLTDRKSASSAKSFEKDDAQHAARGEEKKQLSKLNETVEVTAESAHVPAANAAAPRPTGTGVASGIGVTGGIVGGLAGTGPRTDRDRVTQNQSLDAHGNVQQRKFVIQPQQQAQSQPYMLQQPSDQSKGNASPGSPAPAPAASSSAPIDVATNAQVRVDQEGKKEAVAGPLTLQTRQAGRTKAVLPNLRANGFGGPFNGGTMKVSAGQAVSWKISPEGKLLRNSSDQNSWQPVELPSAASLHSLASNNLDVWVGGAPLGGETAGALFHTTDGGEHWQRVYGPWTGDILALQSSSANSSVTVRTAGGEWQSQDVGQNWIRTR